MDNNPKQIMKATQELLKAKKGNVLNWLIQSPDLNPVEHACLLLKQKGRKTHKQAEGGST